MNKLWLIGIVMIFLVGTVLAAAPTTPTTLSPANNSLVVGDISLTCSGSTDGDGDTIYYQFWIDSTNFTFWDNSTSTCKQSFCNWSTGEPDGADNVLVLHNNTGEWSGSQTASTFYALCENATDFNISSDKKNWGDRKTYCQGLGNGFKVMAIESEEKQVRVLDYIASTDIGNGAEYGFGGNDIDGDLRWGWFNSTTLLLQNSTATSLNLMTIGSNSYYWKCRAWANGDYSSYAERRVVRPIDFYNCTSGNVAMNFTLFDEERRTATIPNMSFSAEFTLTSLVDSGTFNFALTGDDNYSLCFDPAGEEINISGLVDFSSTNTSYSYPRQYYFDDAVINGSDQQNYALYLLDDTYASAVTFTATRGGIGVEDILIYVQRYDPGTGVYDLVAVGQTDSVGQEIIYLRLTDAWYYVTGYEDGVSVYDPGESEHLLTTAYTMYLSSGAGGYPSDPGSWFNFDTITYNLTWNASGDHNFRVAATDTTGASSTMCLKVVKTKEGDQSDICYICETTAAVNINCTVTDLNAGYLGKFIVFKNSIWQVVHQIGVDLTSGLEALVGLDGPFYAFMIIGILAFIGLFNPAVSIILALFGAIVSFAIGFIDIAWYSLISIIVTGVIVAVKSRH